MPTLRRAALTSYDPSVDKSLSTSTLSRVNAFQKFCQRALGLRPSIAIIKSLEPRLELIDRINHQVGLIGDIHHSLHVTGADAAVGLGGISVFDAARADAEVVLSARSAIESELQELRRQVEELIAEVGRLRVIVSSRQGSAEVAMRSE